MEKKKTKKLQHLVINIFLFIVDKRKVIKLPTGGTVHMGASVVDMLDEFECFFVPVDKSEGVFLWIHSQKL